MQPMSSVITGLALLDSEASTSTGQRHGAIASERSLAAARTWLLAQPSVQAADQALVISLQSSLGVGVSLETRMMFPEEGRPYRVVSSCLIQTGDAASITRAADRIRAAMAPDTRERLENMVVALNVATAGQRRSEDAAMAMLEIYVSALMRYPADVARDACMALMTMKWFPVLGKVTERCDKLASGRREMLGALERWKPETEKQRVEREADAWLAAAYQADSDVVSLKRRDPDAASEAAEFSPIAWANYKRLSAEARAL